MVLLSDQVMDFECVYVLLICQAILMSVHSYRWTEAFYYPRAQASRVNRVGVRVYQRVR